MLATTLKVPALFFLALVVTFPSPYVFNALVRPTKSRCTDGPKCYATWATRNPGQKVSPARVGQGRCFTMGYHHTQKGPLHYIMFATAAIMFLGAWLAREEPIAAIVVSVTGLLVFVLAFAFVRLTVQDEVDCLAIRFGPLPLFSKRIPYGEITAVEPDRTNFLDGWGVHWIPGRGWTYNLWGFDCVKLTLGSKVIRVGTDDVENLVEFLRGKIDLPDKIPPLNT